MNKDSQILKELVYEDFGLSGNRRWFKGEEHDSLVIDDDKGIFFWNSRGIVGKPLDYLMKVRNLDRKQAVKLLEEIRENLVISTIRNNKNQTVIVNPKLVSTFFQNGLNDREYFYKRGLTDTTINMFRLGKFNGYSTVPFFENDEFRNFQCRKENPKKMFGYYKNIGPLLFNSDLLRLVDRIYYTEGPVDAMILVQNGLPAISSNCAGGYLNSWYSRFVRVKEIYILFDNDDAGTEESKRLAKFLGENRCRIYNFWDFNEKGYDPVDYFRDGNNLKDLLEIVKGKFKRSFEL